MNLISDDSENGEYGVLGDNLFIDEVDVLFEIYVVGMCDLYCISWDLEGEYMMYFVYIGEW